jgi:hypothetical protein
MNVGPIRRLAGTLGLCALIPIAVLLATGRITPPDAALRAASTLVVVMLVGRGASWWIARMARGYELGGQPDGG